MAQTRATSKALRIPLGFIMALGGYETTPAEEVTEEILKDHPTDKPPTAPPQQKPSAPPQGVPLKDEAKPEVETLAVEGIIAEFRQKDGEKNGKPWTLTTVKLDNGTELKTFDTKFAETLYKSQQNMIPLKLTYDSKSMIMSIAPLESREPGED
jgi:hypothetical protein